MISDKGSQFWPCEGYRKWCKRHGITPRFGACGKHGSIDVIERFIKTLKGEATRRILLALQRGTFRRELLPFRD